MAIAKIFRMTTPCTLVRLQEKSCALEADLIPCLFHIWNTMLEKWVQPGEQDLQVSQVSFHLHIIPPILP